MFNLMQTNSSKIAKYKQSLMLLGMSFGLIYIGQENFWYEEIVITVKNVYLAFKSYIHKIDDASSLQDQYFPTIVTLLFIAFIFLHKAPMPRWLRCSTILYTFLLHTIYIIFRLSTFNLHDSLNVFASVVFYCVELIHYIMMCCLYLQLAWPIEHTSEADNKEKLVKNGLYTPTVAIFIPTYDEPVAILRRTLIGCLAIDYPHKQVYLLDDTNRVEMRRLAAELGCRYIARRDNSHAKAGNLNNALRLTDEELIAFFDCDNIPARNFLSRLVGFFYDPKVAMVISSLHYYNANEESDNIGVEMLVATDHAKSLSNSQTGRDTFNALLCFGTSYIVRRKSLEEIGGIPTETLCEDWATSIKLQAMGLKTIFVNEILSSGVAAENLSQFVQQRLRWCQGTLQSLYVSTNPLRIKGFNVAQRAVHFFGVLYYLMYPVTVIAMFVPLLYFFFGIVPIEANLAQFIVFFLPHFIMQNAMYLSLSRRFSSLISSQVSDYIMSFPLTIVVAKTFFKPFGKRFTVTKKGIINAKTSPVLVVALPMLVMFIVYLAAIIIGSKNVVWLGVGTPFLAFAAWCVYRMIFFWMSFRAAVDLPQMRRAVRFKHTLTCRLTTKDNHVLADHITISNISDHGLEIQPGNYDVPDSFLISLPQLAVHNIEVSVARKPINGSGYGLEFKNICIADSRKLMVFMYCTPGRWDNMYLSEKIIGSALMKFIIRLGPFRKGRKAGI